MPAWAGSEIGSLYDKGINLILSFHDVLLTVVLCVATA